MVTTNRPRDVVEDAQMSAVHIPIKEIKSIPMFMGEADVIKTIQLMPGVQSGTEGTSGIYVRGGGPDQNLFLLDGVPIYNANHLFGFFSVFNPDAISNITLTKGGISRPLRGQAFVGGGYPTERGEHEGVSRGRFDWTDRFEADPGRAHRQG